MTPLFSESIPTFFLKHVPEGPPRKSAPVALVVLYWGAFYEENSINKKKVELR